MNPLVMYGKPPADEIRRNVSKMSDGKATLCAIGFEEPRWRHYVGLLADDASAFGICLESVVLPKGADVDALAEIIEQNCARKDVHGVIVQQPLDGFSAALDHICVAKDVDCLSSASIAALYRGVDGFRPATATAAIRLMDYYGITMRGKNVCVVGRGSVGKSLAHMLLQRDATVTVCHSKTENLAELCRNADIVISACGVPRLITADFVTPRTVVVDIGFNLLAGESRGDVSSEAARSCRAYSPVPGGVGAVTRAALFENTLAAYLKK